MGTTLYVALNPNDHDIDLSRDRVFLADIVGDHKSMNALCGKLGVPSLSDFQSYDPRLVAEEFLEDEETRQALIAKAAPLMWFNPADALPTVRALMSHYTQTPFMKERGCRRKVDGKWQWEPMDRTDDLLDDLRDLEAILLHAMQRGVKFRLYIGF